jgi:hypothetical protein
LLRRRLRQWRPWRTRYSSCTDEMNVA